MSIGITYFTCTKCDFRQGDAGVWGRREYVLADGARIPVWVELGYCEDCVGIVAVEALDQDRYRKDLEKAEKQLAALGRWWWLTWLASHREEREYKASKVQDATLALNLIAARKSPPRCLNCGSQRVIAPLVTNECDWEDETKPKKAGSPHPGCGGDLLMVTDGSRMAFRPSIRSFTPEGEFIERQFVD